ncbi:MAG: S24 family peptidase [Armatimonadia bacterium]
MQDRGFGVKTPHMPTLEPKSAIALRIESRLKELQLSASAASLKAGLSRFAISNIYKNPKSKPRGHTLEQLARVLEVSPDWILSGRGDAPAQPGAPLIPILTWVSAGSMAKDDGQQDIIGEVEAGGLDPKGRWIALRVEGDSMDRISPPGSLIFVNLADRRLVTNACFVISNDEGEASYKRFRSNPARFEPVSTNPAHEPIFPDGEPTVLGRVRRSIIDM